MTTKPMTQDEVLAVLRELREPYACMASSHEGEQQGAEFARIVAALDATIAAWNVSPSADVVGRFNEGDRVAWTNPFGDVFPGTVKQFTCRATYSIDLDDGTWVAEAPDAALSQLAQQGGESE